MAKLKPSDENQLWVEATRRSRLTPETVTKAKELEFGPRTLIKNIPSPVQPWKAPVEDWIRELYQRRQRRTEQRRPRREQATVARSMPLEPADSPANAATPA